MFITDINKNCSLENTYLHGGKTYTVSFRSNGGSAVQTQTVEEGAAVTRPVSPTRSGYTFQGWYKNAALTQPWDFDSDVITANTTLYAKWSRNTGGTCTYNNNIVIDGIL